MDSVADRLEHLRLNAQLVRKYATHEFKCECCGATTLEMFDLTIGGADVPDAVFLDEWLAFARPLIESDLRPDVAVVCWDCKRRFGRIPCGHRSAVSDHDLDYEI